MAFAKMTRWFLTACVAGALAAIAGAAPVEALDDHPNPAWARPWVSLNGDWRFDFDPGDKGLEERWFEGRDYTRTIVVPYPWQSALSGIADLDHRGAAWYERDVRIPEDLPGSRVFLVFGAVDWHARVWIDGQEAVEHEGGFTPFEVELTRFARRGETVRVTVRAFDDTDPETLTGKQTGWYTPSGGIWQTVYLEGRGPSYWRQAHVYPDIDAGRAVFRCEVVADAPGSYDVVVHGGELPLHGEATVEGAVPARTLFMDRKRVRLVEGINRFEVSVNTAGCRLWTPSTPWLQEAVVSLRQGDAIVDEAQTYFGMRKVSRGTWDDSEYEYILLNDKPIYLRGALHQSFNPWGLYTAPDDAFLRREYEKAKELGLNFIRIHIKLDEPRALYWASRVGVMLMCDIPNFWKKSPRAMRLWEETLRGAVDRDFNHPGIFSWCNFNETWGIGDGGYDRATQEWVRDMYMLAGELDPTRLIEDNSPCNYDHVVTDINSWHFYIEDYAQARTHIEHVVENTYPGSTFNYAEGWTQETAPLINSEYGGVSAAGGDRDVGWVFPFLTNLLRRHDKICGYVYTELSDIEWEHNGFLNYDRSEKLFPYPAGITLADLQGEEFPVLDCPPYQRVEAGLQINIPVLLSHWSERAGLTLRMTAHGSTVDGLPWERLVGPQEMAVQAAPYAVTPQGDFPIIIPNAVGLMSVVVEVLSDGERVGANYCVLDVRGGDTWAAPGEYAVAIPVDSFHSYGFAEPGVEQQLDRGKVFGEKSGHVEYRVRLPRDIKAGDVQACRLVVELASKAGDERKDWPQRRNRADYPQTDGRIWPSDIDVSINGYPLDRVSVENDFADARGVLSHVAGHHHGSRGVVVELPIEGRALASIQHSLRWRRPIRLRFEVAPDAAHVGGLSLYGAEMGEHAAEPTLVFSLSEDAERPEGQAEPINAFAERRAVLMHSGPAGHEWRYTTEAPEGEWTAAEYDDSGWSAGRGGFGSEGTPGVRLTTPWHTSGIWLRTVVTPPRDFARRAVLLDLHHDEDVEIFVNGRLLLKRKDYVTDYVRLDLSKEQKALFRPGRRNVIAVHCRQTRGGQSFDLGMVAVGR